MTLHALALAAALLAAPHEPHNTLPRELPPGAKRSADTSRLSVWISVRVLAIEGEKLYLAVDYHVRNHGMVAFDPGAHGLFLPALEGVENVKTAPGTRGAKSRKRGVSLLHPIAPGAQARVTASMQLKYSAAVQTLRLKTLLRVRGYSVQIRKYKGIKIQGSLLGDAEEFAHGMTEPLLVYQTPRTRADVGGVDFRIAGLPLRDRSGPTLFAVVALLLLLGGGVVAVWLPRRSVSRARETVPTDATERAVDSLVQLERDVLLGLISAADAEERRLVLVGAAPGGGAPGSTLGLAPGSPAPTAEKSPEKSPQK